VASSDVSEEQSISASALSHLQRGSTVVKRASLHSVSFDKFSNPISYYSQRLYVRRLLRLRSLVVGDLLVYAQAPQISCTQIILHPYGSDTLLTRLLRDIVAISQHRRKLRGN